MLLISDIQKNLGASTWGVEADFYIQDIVVDSRQINAAIPNQLFVAIATEHRDGHNFITDAYNKGVRVFLVSSLIGTDAFLEATFLIVPDTIAALQQLAINVRNRFSIPVVGITGSNGKTIVKEWLYSLLTDLYNIVRSPKSYNSQIGVPLSVWKIETQHTLGIFEAGISQIGEMELLEKIISPTIGIFTNIGEAHAQGFENSRRKIDEKLKLFCRSKVLIYCKDYSELNEAVIDFAKNLEKFSNKQIEFWSWSFKQDAKVVIYDIRKENGKSILSAKYNNEPKSITIPFVDAASIENAINCWVLLLYLGIKDEYIQEKMLSLKPLAMRLELLQGEQNCIIINDAYSADLRSLSIGLDMLEQQKTQKGKTVFLSDLYQTGKTDKVLYETIAAILNDKKVNRLIAVGPCIASNKDCFNNVPFLETHYFQSTEDLLENFYQYIFENEAILIKGARSFMFEKIILLLEQKIHQTVLSVNLTALRQNLEVFRRRLSPGTKTMAMVKASSYGSGGAEIARVLKDAGVDYLTVAYADEGVALRKASIDMPIMVMSPYTEAFDRMIVWKIEPEIFNLRSLNQFITVAQGLGAHQYPIHLKLDTGMHRLGFMPDEIAELIKIIKQSDTIRVASIFSHLAAADDKSFDDFTQQQADSFEKMTHQIVTALGYTPMLHLCNTAGIVRFPQFHFDMVRLGLGLYGIDSSGLLNNQLQQISSLRTTIAQIKEITAGETIGYSRKGKAYRDMRIATICIGYADGFPRALSNQDAYVIIANKSAPIVGNIAMDMCMVDITDIDGVNEGDEVIIFGDALPIQQVARWAGTIPYEIMTNIAQRVKRVYLREA